MKSTNLNNNQTIENKIRQSNGFEPKVIVKCFGCDTESAFKTQDELAASRWEVYGVICRCPICYQENLNTIARISFGSKPADRLEIDNPLHQH